MSHESFSPRYRHYVLFILFLTYVLNFLDRQLMTILLEPIKQEFGASDTAMGFLTGFAFALFYATRPERASQQKCTITPKPRVYGKIFLYKTHTIFSCSTICTQIDLPI